MSGKWFVQHDDRVEGPYSSDDLRARLSSGALANHHLVWGPGMSHWRNLNWWSNEGTSVTLAADSQTSAPAQDIWHYALNGQSHGPYSKENLTNELRKLTDVSEVLVWTKGMKEWAPLFEFHDILTHLGVNKRIYPRADIDGQVIIKTAGGTLVAPAMSISEGGMGVVLSEGLTAGAQVTIELQSPVFPSALQAKCDVRYVADGIAGLRFTNLSAEAKSTIVSFVRQSHTRFVLRTA